jgi:hypothetical protein
MRYPNPAVGILVPASAQSLSRVITMPSLFASSRWLALVGLTILAVGCKKKIPDPDTAGAAPPMVHTGAPLTEGDCKEFAEKLEKAVAAGDSRTVERLFASPTCSNDPSATSGCRRTIRKAYSQARRIPAGS